ESRGHQCGAPGETVDEADQDRPPHRHGVMLCLLRGLSGYVAVRVDVVMAAVLVLVQMDGAATPHGPQEVQAEPHHQDGAPGLAALGEPGRDLGVERDHRHTGGEQRRGVPESPDGSDERRAQDPSALAHHGGHGGEMVDVERVAEAEDEAQAEDGERARRHEKDTPICHSASMTMATPANEMTSALATGR